MISAQLKAKSGLHAGATWLLTQNFFRLGCSPSADVFLCDAEIPDILLAMRRRGKRFEISQIDPQCKLQTLDKKPIDSSIVVGQNAILEYRYIQIEIQIINSSVGFTSSISDNCTRLGHLFIELLRSLGARAIAAILFLISLVFTAYILFFGSVGTVRADAELVYHQLTERRNNPNIPVVHVDEEFTRNVKIELDDFFSLNNLKNIKVDIDNQGIRFDGKLSRAQIVLLEQKLIRLARDYGDKVVISASIQLNEAQRIVDDMSVEQLILGQQPVAILKNGSRLYLGGKYHGLTVADIKDDVVLLTDQNNSAYRIQL